MMRKLIFALMLLAAIPTLAETPCLIDGGCPYTCDDLYQECLNTTCAGLTGPAYLGCKSGCGIDKMMCKSASGPSPI